MSERRRRARENDAAVDREPAAGRDAIAPRRGLRRRFDFLQLALPFFAPREPQPSAPGSPRPAPTATPAPHAATHADATAGATRDAVLFELWEREAPGWSERWGVRDLRREVRLELSHRMRSSLGGFYAKERLIRIADTLLEASPQLLHEVLCHEAAHAAVELLHGPRARSHGREWRELMRRVGLAPRVHVPGEELGGASQRAARKRWVWRHRCPHCRAERLAGRPVRQWRCRACQDAGRDGKLIVTRVSSRGLRDRTR